MFRGLLLLFIAVPIIELALLIEVGRWIGLWPTLALILITGVAGAALASSEGLRAWRAFQREIFEGKVPGRPILDGLSIFAGGALLLTPGLLTDVLGFTLVFRPSRRWLEDRIMKRLGGSLIQRGQVYVRTRDGWTTAERPAEEQETRPKGREIDQP